MRAQIIILVGEVEVFRGSGDIDFIRALVANIPTDKFDVVIEPIHEGIAN